MVSERVLYPYQERAGVATPLNYSRIKQISQGIGRGEDIEVQSSDHNARDCTPSFFCRRPPRGGSPPHAVGSRTEIDIGLRLSNLEG